MGDHPDERPKQLTPLSFGRGVKLGVPQLDAACSSRPKLAEKARYNSLLKMK